MEQKRFDDLSNALSQDGELIHVSKLLERAARLWPTKIMLYFDNAQLSYQELYARALQLAHRLRSLGVNEGDHVVIFWENSFEFYIAYFAVWLAGAIVAPLNVFLSEQEFTRIVHDAEAQLLIISPTLQEKIKEAIEVPFINDISSKSPYPPKEQPLDLKPQDTKQVAAILYTSGTTGFPKGVMLSSHNIVINAIQGIARFKVSQDERVFCPLPLFHSLPQNLCLWSTIIAGASVIIVPKIERKWIINGLSYKPTMIVAVPALYGLFCMMKRLNFSRVKWFVAGGDALSDKIRSYFAMLYGRKICNGYGLTEASPFISIDCDDYTQPTSTIGKPFIGITASIRNEQGEELKRGRIGRLFIKGDNIMLGYYKAPEATNEILHDGWLNTGDLAYLTKEGKIVLAGRERDLISNKGLKIYPQEVENILLSHPDVTQAAVIGVKNNGEEIPIAYVASKRSDEEALGKELRALCTQNLAPYKVPRQFIIRRDLPVTTTGKVNKKLLNTESLATNPSA